MLIAMLCHRVSKRGFWNLGLAGHAIARFRARVSAPRRPLLTPSSDQGNFISYPAKCRRHHAMYALASSLSTYLTFLLLQNSTVILNCSLARSRIAHIQYSHGASSPLLWQIFLSSSAYSNIFSDTLPWFCSFTDTTTTFFQIHDHSYTTAQTNVHISGHNSCFPKFRWISFLLADPMNDAPGRMIDQHKIQFQIMCTIVSADGRFWLA